LFRFLENQNFWESILGNSIFLGRAQVEHLVKYLEVLGRSCKILEDLVQELEISCRFLQVLDKFLSNAMILSKS
jgi:hypothetical protein